MNLLLNPNLETHLQRIERLLGAIVDLLRALVGEERNAPPDGGEGS